MSSLAAETLEFCEPPYDLTYLKKIHKTLFVDLYQWAGEIRTIDISKGATRFCTASRREPEINRLFEKAGKQHYYVNFDRAQLIKELSELYSDLNAIHPFRDGNGRAQRILFEHIAVHCGFDISWKPISMDEWIDANIQGFYCNHEPMVLIFEKCIGKSLKVLVKKIP